MRNLFRLFVPLIINPYYYLKKIKKKMIKNHFDYENTLYNKTSFISLAIACTLKKKDYKECKYLEIGVFDNKVFNTIPLPINQKIGVDPLRGGTHRMTSDDFFKSNKQYFDVIFIDGLHSYDQCSNDYNNRRLLSFFFAWPSYFSQLSNNFRRKLIYLLVLERDESNRQRKCHAHCLRQSELTTKQFNIGGVKCKSHRLKNAAQCHP